MPFSPEDARKHNPLIKLDRHAQMWSDLVNNAVKRGRPEMKAIDEANSAINMDITRSRVSSQDFGKPLEGYDPRFDPRNPPQASGSKQGRMTQDQALYPPGPETYSVGIPPGGLPGEEAPPRSSGRPESSARPEQPFNNERPYTAAPGDPENTLPAGRASPSPRSNPMPPPPPVPSPIETISERFPKGNVPPPDFETAIKRFDAEDRKKPKGKPVMPGTQERFLDPTKVID